MMQRSIDAVALLFTLVLAAIAGASSGMARAGELPNIAVIFVDDLGYGDLGAYGNPVDLTPNIDQLAREGIRLDNFYVNSPICSASRVALTTGRYPQRSRIHSYLDSRASNRQRLMPDWLDPDVPTLARVLSDRNYRTGHFGKWHMGGGRDVDDAPAPRAYGFAESLVSFEGLGDRILSQLDGNQQLSWTHGRGSVEYVPKDKMTQRYVDHAIQFIKQDRGRPFYVELFPGDVHDPHQPSEASLAKWGGKTANPHDAAFFAVLEELDRQIGRFLDALDEMGIADDTIVIFTSDNGPTDWPHYYDDGNLPPGSTGPLFGRKWSLYEGGIRVPFIARWPRHFPSGALDRHSVVAAIDLFPTLAALAAIDVGEVTFDGLDRSGVLLGTPAERSRPLFWEYGVHGSIQPGRREHRSPQLAMREGVWKLLADADGGRLALFDLGSDIAESHNLATARADVVDKMLPRLRAWWTEMSGYYPAVAGRH